MKQFNIVVSGAGAVGKSVLKMLKGLDSVRLVAVCEAAGSVVNPNGLSIDSVLSDLQSPAQWAQRSDFVPKKTKDIISSCKADILLELTPTDFETGEPALGDILFALEKGIHVVTSAKSHCKSPEDLQRVHQTAKTHGALFWDGASVMGAVPAIEMKAGIGFEVTRIRGILNGSTNYLIGKLETGAEWEEAYTELMAMGMLEKANPKYDIEGYDPAAKLINLVYHYFGRAIRLSDVSLQGLQDGKKGIDGLTGAQVRQWNSQGKTVRLIAQATLENGKVVARVGPLVLDRHEPLANVNGALNALQVTGMANGTPEDVFISGFGAGPDVTAGRVVGNLNALMEELRRNRKD